MREPGQDEGGHAGHDAAGCAGGADPRVAVGRDRGRQPDARGGQRHVRVPAAERGDPPVPADRAHRDDAAVGGRVVHQARTLTVVAGRGHQHHVPAQRVRHRRPLGRAAAGRGRVALAGQAGRAGIQRQGDDARAVIDRVDDAMGDGPGQPPGDGPVRVQRVVELQGDPDGQDLRVRRDPEQAVRAAGTVPVRGDGRGDRRPVDAPERPARRSARTGVIGTRRHRAGQVRVPGVDAGAQHGHGNPGALGARPGLPHVQAAQPPLLGLDALAREGILRRGVRRGSPAKPGDGNNRSKS